jgi:hypothetical protein
MAHPKNSPKIQCRAMGKPSPRQGGTRTSQGRGTGGGELYLHVGRARPYLGPAYILVDDLLAAFKR